MNKKLCILIVLVLCITPLFAQSIKKNANTLFNEGKNLLFVGDYYKAQDAFTSALAINPTYADAWALMAECQYKLGEYERAVTYISEAFKYGPRSAKLLSLNGFALIGMGNITEARKMFEEVLLKRTNDRDARFGLSLLDVQIGRPQDAKARLSASLKTAPEDARAFLSLALIAKAENKTEEASFYLSEALHWTRGDAATLYAAGLLFKEENEVNEAARLAKDALSFRPNFPEAEELLASLYYDATNYTEARKILDTSLKHDRYNVQCWFLLGLVEQASGNYKESEYAYRTVTDLRPDDEMARIALENLIIDTTPFENSSRANLALWRFDRARDFKKRLLFQKAITEYRRGLLIDPYSNIGRREYAELLRDSGLASTYFAELNFLSEQGKSDQALSDAIEIYKDILQSSVSSDWNVTYSELQKSPITFSVFSVGNNGIPYHSGSDLVIARYLRDSLTHIPSYIPSRSVSRVDTFSDAYRMAREAKTDYFILVNVDESERDINITCELRVSASGVLVSRIIAPRSGNDRVSLSVERVVNKITEAVPFSASVIRTNGNVAIIDRGKASGLKVSDKFLVIKKGFLKLSKDGLGLTWNEKDVVAKLSITKIDDDVSETSIERVGFFDRLNPGDSVVKEPNPEETEKKGNVISVRDSTLPHLESNSSSYIWATLFERLRSLY